MCTEIGKYWRWKWRRLRVRALIFVCRPDGVGTVTLEEKEKFQEVKERLRILLEKQITNFRYCFPFGRPEGALKGTLSLLERVKKRRSNCSTTTTRSPRF